MTALFPDKIQVFCDFDGTITHDDIGNRLFDYFSDGRARDAVARWEAGEIDSQQCLIEEAASLRDISESELHAFLDGFAIDPGFLPFAVLCEYYNVPLTILSDGLDLYINYILNRHRLNHIPVCTNSGQLENGRIITAFPWSDNNCPRCANCKGYQISRLTPSGHTSIYIGDGRSDLCAIGTADVLFATGFLADYCTAHDIDYIAFDSFVEVITKFRELIGN